MTRVYAGSLRVRLMLRLLLPLGFLQLSSLCQDSGHFHAYSSVTAYAHLICDRVASLGWRMLHLGPFVPYLHCFAASPTICQHLKN
jgi:hypothetical protein